MSHLSPTSRTRKRGFEVRPLQPAGHQSFCDLGPVGDHRTCQGIWQETYDSVYPREHCSCLGPWMGSASSTCLMRGGESPAANNGLDLLRLSPLSVAVHATPNAFSDPRTSGYLFSGCSE